MKKKPKLSDGKEVKPAQTSTSENEETVCANNKVVPEDISKLLTRTKEKLKVFAVSDEIEKTQTIDSFDFNCLKRDKVRDIDGGLQDYPEAAVQDQQADKDSDIIASTSDTNEQSRSRTQNSKLAKFSSQKSVKNGSMDRSGSTQTAKVGTGVKYTQLEQQFVDIKGKFPDTVLFVECGYKYRFFGNDAKVNT